MEIADGEKKRPPDGDNKSTKRKMKTASQLELLEKTYAVETYPSESLRAELSKKLGLTDRQLQMWFCHRRLKDRKVAPVKRPRKEAAATAVGGDEVMAPVAESAVELGPGPASSPFRQVDGRKVVARAATAVARIGNDLPVMKRYYEPPQSISELRAIAFVESQLGEPLREDGPILGVEFDPLPPDAFGAPLAITGQQKQSSRPYDGKVFERQDPTSIKASSLLPAMEHCFVPSSSGGIKKPTTVGSVHAVHSQTGPRALHEYQFLPEQPSIRSDSYERVAPSHFYDSSVDTPSGRPSSFRHGNEQVAKSYGFQGQMSSVNLLPQQGRQGHVFSSAPTEYDSVPHKNSLPSVGTDAHFGGHPVVGLENTFVSSDRRVFHNEDASRMERKRKSEDVRIAKEVDTHENLIRKEPEYDDLPHKNSLMTVEPDAQFGAHPIVGLENTFVSSDRRIFHEEDASRMERKRKLMQNEDARIAKEVEAHEKRIRKELERQDILRRKREEQVRREMEKHDRERRKEEERLMREKQREEERFQREQRREIERRERFLQKESLRIEKLRQKEEMRREKEAARLKAANERATARRIARESMELIEDERLELMELAASSKGLPSIISLDSDTLQHLDLFRDKLVRFPPKSVRLKKPFAFQPWTSSEEDIGNLLMVWRFLVTFADVLNLWPFTLDEFVQAFHDYDPRLLGEIHVALLKSIIKDIEDVARTPSIGLGANQNSAANPGGGHPQIVEGAYAWGFDIRSWQRHLNPLTWPEILRQFALSAGFGPQLKKRSVPRAYFRDDNEGHDGEDIVSTLRNGAAAENAVAVMQEKGFSHRRRSRHRLTPGTVKFAAFHVLSLEGSKGLTILEVADKIQKSGLRDLTTSKTPEASIAAALSRDGLLFERTAPSTYCVRPAFRKDPADADAILSAAREKIQIFESGFSDSEEAEKDTEDAEDIERDEDSECDGADDPEVDDIGTLATPNKVLHASGIKGAQADSSQNEKGETVCDEVGGTPQNGLRNVGKGFSPFPSEGSKDASGSGAINGQSLDVASNRHEASNDDQDDTEIDESNAGEPWVQGLMEGEYSNLSVEERLNSLVALISVAIEGNSIRVVLEERLEAANALKKQMWAEAQLDKRRMKEEYVIKQYSSFMGGKTETNVTGAAAEGNHSPLLGVDSKGNGASLNPAAKQETSLDPHNAQNYFNNMSTDRNLLGQEFSTGQDNLQFQHGYAAEKSRSQLKSYIGHKAEEMYVYRSLPLGQDRRRNRYWQFATSSSRNDPGSGRIFLESQNGCWRLIDSEEAFDALLASLDTRGIRESHLQSMLQKIEASFKDTAKRNLGQSNTVDPTGPPVKAETIEFASSPDCAVGTDNSGSMVCDLSSDTVENSTSFQIELGRNETEKSDALERYQDFEKWLWQECFNPSMLCALKYGKKRCSELLVTCDFCHNSYSSKDKHCPSCHKTFDTFHSFDVTFGEHVAQCEEKRRVDPTWNIHCSDSSLPTRGKMLKAQLAFIEASIPPEALQSFWTEVYRKSWGVKLHSASSVEDLFQLLTLLEGAIKRDYLSSSFETTKELLGSSKPVYAVDDDATLPASVPVLPWIPQTTAAVALRLMEFDASISYMLQQKVESHKDKEAGEFIPSKYAVVKNIQDLEPSATPDQVEYPQEDFWADPGSGRSLTRGRGSRGRGRGRSRGGRWQRGSGSSRAECSKENAGYGDRLAQGQVQRARTRGRGRRRGRRTIRKKQKPENKVVKKDSGFHNISNAKQNTGGESPRSSGGEEWDRDGTGRMYADEAEDNSAGMSESDDNVQASGDEYDDRGAVYVNTYSGKSKELMDDSEEDDDEGADEGDGDRDGDEEGDEDGEGGGNGDGYGGMDDGDGSGDGDGNGDEDEGTASMSSEEYSD
ncbi:homeobox-DDT domain protein RLT2-like isoform X2 [Magnolia sinica]|uniref:homeobox-DDT domain protein RLT2-like isoform X2 n=1 Tax=Magnolia sinica TaxID=86752 RepID=UPI00265A2A6C|nr:homeobox-DDT domain protein RLT2-like isoform X2 [Magnolia sinica]